MKRYALFAGDYYYPSGGWNDFRGSFETVEAAVDAVAPHYDWYHVVDLTTGELVKDQG